MKKFLEEIKLRSKEILDIYNDQDGSRKEEIDIFAGNKHINDMSTKTPDVWNNFYEKVKEIKNFNKKAQNNDFNEGSSSYDKIFHKALEEISNKSIFSAEENKGKCVDMHDIFLQYLNIKKVAY
jgi:splicing factor 3A subunit 3